MIREFCDRCNTETIGEEANVVDLRLCHRAQSCDNASITEDDSEYFLCGDCAKEFKAWLDV